MELEKERRIMSTTKSDFAQKLLNDLRLRKERLSSASSQLTVTTSDAYGNPKQANQGSRQIKTLESVGDLNFKPTKQHKRSNMIIVPFKGGQQNQNTPKIGDFSMVLKFALENGIKLIGSNGTNNNQSHCRSVSHINDISKGAHKLNEILRAYSNGVNIDRHSVEIGNQLLKGAIDLEESLRMLVNLQEASEYMSTPKRKNQIRLLDEEEDDDEVDNNELANKQKQLVLPRFSFDKPRKNNDREKGRISSVIAKLMGLDDMSNNVRTNNTRKESSSEQKVTAAGSKNSDSGNRNNHTITHLAVGKSVIQNSRVNSNTQNSFQEKKKLERETVVKSEERKTPKERTGSSVRNKSTLHSKQGDLKKVRETELRNSSRSKDRIVDPEKHHHHHLPLDKEPMDEQPQKLQTNSRKSEEVVITRPNVQKGKISSRSIKEKSIDVKSLNVVPIERKNGILPHFATPLRHQVPISNDVKEKRHEKKNNFKRTGKESSVKLKDAKELDKEAAAAASATRQSVSSSLMIMNAPDEHSTNLTGHHADQTSLSNNDQQLKHQKKKDQDDSLHNGNSEERTAVSPPSNARKPLALTEDEANLKLILIKSQQFLHTAVALFKLDFPISILHINDYSINQAKDEKVIIDCGYEIIRRKGRRQEEFIHYRSLKLSSIRIDSLDELVRRLNVEFGNLKSYGRIRMNEDESIDNPFNMIENDILVNKDPDINCMWDSGWNDAIFGVAEREETIRDVEKQVLNCLLDEIARDLLSPLNGF
ncbi:uncharacterized protein LOC124938976 [Impatiens glandulifera]|uniref:uncharacterized protein LOC124938976 n=1 Tax=Impatiens glandulifera TaxID=253017 RepID=UPI001FB07F30|nr:uncharacterized protein LOC124938976 [Impatiens glandulifera]